MFLFLYSFVSFQKNMFYFVKIQIKDFCIVDFSWFLVAYLVYDQR